MASHGPCPDAWTRAKSRYVEDLTHAEKQFYMQASPETIFYDASAAEKRHEAISTSRRLMHKLQPFVAAIEQYGQALDVYSNASTLALSPLWGSIRVLLLVWPHVKLLNLAVYADLIKLHVNTENTSKSLWRCLPG